MYLKRSLIKKQAKEILKGNVFKLFIIGLVVSIVSGAAASLVSGITLKNYAEIIKNTVGNYGGGENFDEDPFEDFYFDDDGEAFFNFGKINTSLETQSLSPSASGASTVIIGSAAMSFLSDLVYIASIFLAPLNVALAGFFVLYIRGKRFELDGGVKTVFKEAFKVNYLKKVWLVFLMGLITGLLSLLFIIPGIIFSYSAYFAYQIMCDYPELSAWESIKLSKKIIKGNRFELFLMNLSFIPWAFLCIFIFPIIYVTPYFELTNALYYENFRLRAIQQGRVTEDDFLSDAQRLAKYAQANGVPNKVDPNFEGERRQENAPAWTPVQRPVDEAFYRPENADATQPYGQTYTPYAAQPDAAPSDEPAGEYYTPPASPQTDGENNAPDAQPQDGGNADGESTEE